MYDARRGGSGAPEVRPTRQRTAIVAALQQTDAFLTAQDIHALLRDRGERVGLATIYRCLQSMADANRVDVLRTADGEIAYRHCSEGHHHHLICRNCGSAVEVEGPGVERWADRTAAQHNFTDVSHTLEIFGLCHDCR